MIPVLAVQRDQPRRPPSPFERGPDERTLRLLVDWDSLREGTAKLLLQELVAASLLEAVGVAELLSRHSFRTDAGADSIVATGPEWEEAYIGKTEQFRWEAERLAKPGTAEYEVALANARLAAFSRKKFDALLSGSPMFSGLSREANVLAPEQALALIGLHARSRSAHQWVESVNAWRSPEDYYWLFARCLLPGSQPLVEAAARNRAGGQGDEVIHLASSFLTQVARALRARDHLHVLARASWHADTAFDIAMSFETTLVYLSGAFDSLAALCTKTYGLDVRPKRSKWQLDGWMSKLRSSAGNHVADAAEADDTLKIRKLLGILRNTVHGPVLQPTIMIGSGGQRIVIQTPAEDVRDLEEALAKWQHKPSWWGCHFLRYGKPEPGTTMRSGGPEDPVCEIQLDPMTCLERLLPLAVEALNALVGAIEWLRLDPTGGAEGGVRGLKPVDPEVRSRVLLLGGIG